MRPGSKWIIAPAAALVLLIGGIAAASVMHAGDRSANVRTNAITVTDDRGAGSGRDSAGDVSDDRGAGSGRDSAGDVSDDRGRLSGRDAVQVDGTAFERARAAALQAVPGATVREVGRAASAGAAYHVELIQRDGTKVEVDLNANFQTVRVERSGDDG